MSLIILDKVLLELIENLYNILKCYQIEIYFYNKLILINYRLKLIISPLNPMNIV